MNLLLIGYRGSGKSTVGKIVADKLHLPFADTDDLIIRQAGMDIAQIFQALGEARFRDLETQVLRESLQQDNQVLALGGGAIIREENRRLIMAKPADKVFFLHCDPAILHDRIAKDHKTAAHRPALTPFAGAIAEVQHLLAQRLPWYRQVMRHEIDVTNLSAEQVAKQIIQLIKTEHKTELP